MTDKESMAMALDALETLMIERGSIYEKAIAALKERLADPMREVQRLGQEIEQEPVELPCCGYTDASAVKWNPFNGVVQCHNCGQCYTTPPQRTEPVSDDMASILACRDMLDAQPVPPRTWVGLTDEEILSDDTLRYYYGMNGGAGPVSQKGKKVIAAIEAKLKQKNGYAEENT